MAIEFRHRRGTLAENNAFTGAAGEVVVDTTNNRLRVHDGATAGGIPVGDFINALDYGATGDGVTDDTAAIQTALNTGRVVFLPVGTYKITDSLKLSDGAFYGASLIGEQKENTKIVFYGTGTTPIIYARGGSGVFSNIVAGNFTIDINTDYTGTAIYVNGQCGARFNNIVIDKAKYGIHLHNQGVVGTFTEVNIFDNINIQYSDEAIRIEQGTGDNSFHGNEFNNVYINIGANQIGLNHVSGYYYNGRFRLFMWAHDTTSVYVNADGNAEECIGDITYESFSVGQITGSGRFWFSGFIRGIGGFTDNTVQPSSTEENFACTNYLKSKTQATTGHTIRVITETGQKLGGGDYGLYKAIASNDESFLLNGYNYGSNGKLYLSRTAYQQELSNATVGMHINLNGEEIKTYSSNGLSIKNSLGHSVANFKDTGLTASLDRYDSQVISSGGGSVTMNNSKYADANFSFLLNLRLVGSNYEYRYVYLVNHDGYGANGHATLLATNYALNNTGGAVSSPTITFNTNAAAVVTIASSDRNITVISKMIGIGVL